MQPHDTTKEYAPWVYKHGLQYPYGECQCGCGGKTSIVKMTSNARGIIRGQPYRFIAGHYARTRRIRPAIERFWEKVDRRGPNDCWEWQGATFRRGYGSFYNGECLIGAHRFAYILVHGSIGDDLEICHHCDNPPCCNPSHLFAGTQKDNMQDMIRKGRDNQPVFIGESHPRTHLVANDIREIRRLIAKGATRRVVAERFGIHSATVGDIVKRRSWKHIE